MISPRLRLWRPELRRTVMKVRPEYFMWSTERQERYGVMTPEGDHAALNETLLAELFGRRFASRDAAAASVDRLSLDDRRRWNEALLPLHGVGDDHFHLDESLDKGRTILDFDTVRAFDETVCHFKEKSPTSHDSSQAGSPYRGSLYLNWARLYVDGRFTYATLSMAAGYLYSRLCDVSRELLEARVPCRYVCGRNHGELEGNYRQRDMRVAAEGQEGVAEELQRRIWNYQHERFDALLTDWDAENRCCVYLLDESEPPEDDVHVVFSDKSALAAVRFRSFVRDCRAVEGSAFELSRAFQEERALLARFIEEQHAEVLRTYDPKVVRFRERRKFMRLKYSV